MKKNLGVVQAVYPMPVLMVAAYDENGLHRIIFLVLQTIMITSQTKRLVCCKM